MAQSKPTDRPPNWGCELPIIMIYTWHRLLKFTTRPRSAWAISIRLLHSIWFMCNRLPAAWDLQLDGHATAPVRAIGPPHNPHKQLNKLVTTNWRNRRRKRKRNIDWERHIYKQTAIKVKVLDNHIRSLQFVRVLRVVSVRFCLCLCGTSQLRPATGLLACKSGINVLNFHKIPLCVIKFYFISWASKTNDVIIIFLLNFSFLPSLQNSHSLSTGVLEVLRWDEQRW